jgi:hypothetical protein
MTLFNIAYSHISNYCYFNQGHAVEELVEALRYKRVQFPLVSLAIFSAVIHPASLWLRVRLSL